VPWQLNLRVFESGTVSVGASFLAVAAQAMDANLLFSATLDIESLDPAIALSSASGSLTELAPGTFGYPAAAVPEPGTWAQLLGGLGLLLIAHRRRTRFTRA
jgi:hypothetical protein